MGEVGRLLVGVRVFEVGRDPMGVVWMSEFGGDSGGWCGVGDGELGGR